MPLPWRKLPALAGDPRLELLSADGCCVVLRAWMVADDEGRLPSAGAVPPFEALVQVLARVLPEARARAAIADAIRLGFFSDDAHLLDWIGARAPTAEDDEDSAPAVPDLASSAPPTPRRGRGRPLTGAAPMTPAERKQKERFELRVGSFRDVPVGVTWEAWRSQRAAAAVTETSDAGHETPAAVTKGRHENPDDVTKTGHENASRKTATGRAGSEPSEPSGNSEEKNRTEKDADSDARAASRKPVTKIGHENGEGGHENPSRHESPPRLPSEEHLSSFDADDLLGRLTLAVVVDGESRIILNGGPQCEVAFRALVRDQVARQKATIDQVVEAFAHGARLAWVAKARSPVDLPRVMKEDARLFFEWLSAVQRTSAKPSPTRSPVRSRSLAVDAPALPPAAAAATLARLRGGAPTHTPDPAVTPAEGTKPHA